MPGKNMAKKILFVSGVLLLGVAILALQWRNAEKPRAEISANPGRIVSLAPAITETLYALGLGDRVVGVTEFCARPAAAATKPKVGGFREVNLEAILRTRPDLVVLPANMAHFKNLIEDVGIRVLLFDSQSLDGFLRDVAVLGGLAGSDASARDLISRFAQARNKGIEADGAAPLVLFALMSPDECQGPISELTVIGKDEFYDELIRLAGGRNAYAGKAAYPRLGLESIIALNPDMIIVAAPDVANLEELRSRWNSIGVLKAISNGNLLILDEAADTVPGPASIATLEKIAGAISGIIREKAGGSS